MTAPERAGRREWIGLAVLALPCVVYAMDLTVLNLALPKLSADLRPSAVQQLWIVDVYGFMVAGLLITMGSLGDRIGRRRLLLFGAAGFVGASVLAAFATSAAMLIAARALLGVAGATIAPSTLSLIRTMFAEPGQRTFAVGVWITSYSAGAAIGPLAGGALLERFWWGSVFLLGVPVMALLLVLGPRLLPEQHSAGGRLDLGSAALSVAAVLVAVYGIKRGAHGAPALALGVALGAAFWRRQRRLAHPLVDGRLLRSAAFRAALACNTIGFFVVFGTDLLIGQYLQSVLGLSPWLAGIWMTPSAAGFVAGSLLASALVRRAQPGTVVAGGLALAVVGFALVARGGGLAGVVGGSAVYSAGLATVFTLAADLMVGSAPPERAGAAAALNETSSELGGALGIALLGSVAAAVFGPGTVGAAVMDPRLADAARSAFAHALQVTAGVSAVLVAGAAMLAFAVLRDGGEGNRTPTSAVQRPRAPITTTPPSELFRPPSSQVRTSDDVTSRDRTTSTVAALMSTVSLTSGA
jgi:DHA2 family multidrug resistance protein-like MFS transporter